MLVVFQIFLPGVFCGFSGLAKGVTPQSRAKTNSKGPLTGITYSHRMHDKPNPFNSHYLGGNRCQADYEKLKITSIESKRQFLKFHRAGCWLVVKCSEVA